MRRDEARALGDLAGDAVASVASQVREVHENIAGRVFGALGMGGGPVRAIHERASAGAYQGAHKLTGAVVRGGAHALSLTRSQDDPPLENSTAGRLMVGAINGAWGDSLNRRDSPLEAKLTIRCRGRDLDLDPDSLQREFPAPSSRLVIFSHGLCETDDAWKLGAARHVPYGDRLEAELGYTSLYVRYNSGLHISDNGRRLAAVLDELTRNWPVEVGEIALVGHSMGGLVGRSACHYGARGGWVQRVRHVFTLGAPHRGAPLEQAANVACSALSLLPETRGFARPLKVRSAGIKDLRYGYLIDEDWFGHDPDAFLRNTGREIPFLEGANHYFVCATVAEDADGPLSRVLGDLLVLRASAWSHGQRGERMRFPVDQYRHVGGINHFDLLNHPAIYEQIKRWLTSSRPGELGAQSAPVAVSSQDQLLR
jgi:pimeloyl-ACP methyl ester carboxylesterase